MPKTSLRIRSKKTEAGKLEYTPQDSERRQRFIDSLPVGVYVLETIKRVSAPGSEAELRDRLRKYYFSQVAGPVGKAMGGHTGEYVHEIMKSQFSVERDPFTGVLFSVSVFSDISKKDNDFRKAFIEKVKMFAIDFFPDMIFPDFIPTYDYEYF